METQQTITVRSPDLPFPTLIDPLLIEGQPELSYLLVGMSLSLPHLEPFLIRTLNEAKRRVEDSVLLEQIRLVNAQEGQHYRYHARFNAAVGQKFPGLRALEEELAEDCRRFTATRSLKWRLAYAESLEAFTVAFSHFLFVEQALREVQPAAVRELFEWHVAEEFEHRGIVFDVYERIYGDYSFRVAVGLYAQWHFLGFAIRAARLMFAHERAQGRDHGRPAQGRRRLLSLFGQCARSILPKLLASFSPRYQPHAMPMPAGLDTVLQRTAARDTRAAASASRAARPTSPLATPPAPASATIPATSPSAAASSAPRAARHTSPLRTTISPPTAG